MKRSLLTRTLRKLFYQERADSHQNLNQKIMEGNNRSP